MKQYTLLLLFPLALAGFSLPVIPTSEETYVSFNGPQGPVKGGNTAREKQGWYKIVSFDLQSEVPADATHGASRQGSQTHKPLLITKEVDGASPKLFQASTSGEVLSTVQLQTVDEKGSVMQTIQLKKVVISGIKQVNGPGNKPRENIKLNYSEIMLTYKR